MFPVVVFIQGLKGFLWIFSSIWQSRVEKDTFFIFFPTTNAIELAKAVTNPNTPKDLNDIDVDSTSIANPMNANILENLSYNPNISIELRFKRKINQYHIIL